MDMGSILGTILRAILNYKRLPMSTLNGPLVKQILSVANIAPSRDFNLRKHPKSTPNMASFLQAFFVLKVPWPATKAKRDRKLPTVDTKKSA